MSVDKHFPAPKKSVPYRVKCSDETGSITVVFFRANKDWVEKQLPLNQKVIISGKVEYYQGQAQMVHPDTIAPLQDRNTVQTVEPVYPLTQGITNKSVRKAMQATLDFITPLSEWLDPSYKQRNQWPEWHEALKALHTPEENMLSPDHSMRMRLAYDELLANQLTLALVRHRARKINGLSLIHI